MKRLILILIIVFVTSLSFASVSADDGIPDNCPYSDGEFFDKNLFMRMDSNSDVLLFDWVTGDMISMLDMPAGEQSFISSWSPNCAYVTVSQIADYVEGIPQYRTLVWDISTFTPLQQFNDAHRMAHPVTWSDNSDYLLIESRNGAFVWRRSTNTTVQLSSGADSNAQTFFTNSLRWDYDTQQLSGTLVFEDYGTAIYDLNSGQLLAISDEQGRALDVADVQFSAATTSDETYPCLRNRPQGLQIIYEAQNHRIVLRDELNLDVIKVVESDIIMSDLRDRSISYSPSCQYLRVSAFLNNDPRETTIIWDLWRSVPARIFTLGDAHERAHQIIWSPDSNYVMLKTRRDLQLINLGTGESHRLTADLTSDCFSHRKGCRGEAQAYYTYEWDTINNTLELKLIFGNIVRYDLSTGKPIMILNADHSPASAEHDEIVRRRLESPYGCTQRPFYHAGNHIFALKDWLIGDTLFVIEDNLKLWHLDAPGYSPTCEHIIAEVGIEGQTTTSIIVWSLITGERVAEFDTQGQQVAMEWSDDVNNITFKKSNQEETQSLNPT